ncbi:hypothetical protein [Pengzhenrongella phosphoraccumulans]|uniref:hypothetical protein n=1 Tax=Pengzhenrongella phosphoraccumulans TaxID=3114394 RepID=UPI00388D35E2
MTEQRSSEERGTAGRRVAMALSLVGVLALVVAALMRLARPGSLGLAGVLIAAVVVVVLIAAILGWTLGRTALRERAVRAERPGWELLAVASTAELPGALLAAGRWESGLSAGGGTPLTLAVSAAGVELWLGGRTPRSVVALPWDRIAAVQSGRGTIGMRARPALAVHTFDGAELTVLPLSSPSGLLPGGASDVDALVARLRTARDRR